MTENPENPSVDPSLVASIVIMSIGLAISIWKEIPEEDKKRIFNQITKIPKGSPSPTPTPNPEDEYTAKDDYHHIRVQDPDKFDPESFRVIVFGKGIKATIGCPKGKFKKGKCVVGTQTQKILFPRDEYTKEEARKWMKKHKHLKVKRK